MCRIFSKCSKFNNLNNSAFSRHSCVFVMNFEDLSIDFVNELCSGMKITELLSFIRNHKPPQKKREWTDKMCLTEGRKCCVWREIPTHEVEGHLISFVNLWFSTANIEESKICSTITNVLLMFPLGPSVRLLLKDVFDSAGNTAQPPPAVKDRDNVIGRPLVDHLDDEKKADVFAFHNWLKQHFSVLKGGDEKPSKDRHCPEYNHVSQKLRTVLGFCALLLVRMMIKSELQMTNYFPYLASKAFDRLFPELCLNVPLASPAPDCLKLVKSALSSTSTNEANNLLHLLVFQYLKSIAKSDSSSQLTAKILEDGCLNILEGNGMGLVTMFQNVKLMYSNIEERKLLSFIAQGKADDKSKKNLIKFLNTYAKQNSPQHSWKWARILSKEYFADMNIRQNKSLCSKFAALLLHEAPGILKHPDLKSDSNAFTDDSVKWAESVKEELENLNNEYQEELEEICVECLLAQWAEFITKNDDQTLFKYVHCKKVCKKMKQLEI